VSKTKHSHQSYEGPHNDGINQGFDRPYWKFAHHDWRVWVAVRRIDHHAGDYWVGDNFERVKT
jgi:hypothetical protein